MSCLKRKQQHIPLAIFLSATLVGAGSCATNDPLPTQETPVLPAQLKIPHSSGVGVQEIRTLFQSPLAPKRAELNDCDADFRKLRASTDSNEEIEKGTRELLSRDPVKLHWCFYFQVLSLSDRVTEFSYQTTHQKDVLNTFEYLVPVAQAFRQDYGDTRYLQIAIKTYRQMSERVFYRRLELSPEATSELVAAEARNRGEFTPREPSLEPCPVLEKYRIVAPIGPPRVVYSEPVTESAPELAPDAPAPSRNPASAKKVLPKSGKSLKKKPRR